MSDVLVIDASIAIKWYVPEEGADVARSLLDRDDELIAPELLVPEFGNILWKKTRRGELSADEARAIVGAFHEHPLLTFFPNGPLFSLAFNIAVDFGQTVYDSTYVALALSADTRLATADAHLHAELLTTPLASVCWLLGR